MTRATHAKETAHILREFTSRKIDITEYKRRIAALNEELLQSGQTQPSLFDDPELGPPPPEAFQ